MVFGGMPYYLRPVETGLAAEQNIQQIFFDRDVPLKNYLILYMKMQLPR